MKVPNIKPNQLIKNNIKIHSAAKYESSQTQGTYFANDLNSFDNQYSSYQVDEARVQSNRNIINSQPKILNHHNAKSNNSSVKFIYYYQQLNQINPYLFVNKFYVSNKGKLDYYIQENPIPQQQSFTLQKSFTKFKSSTDQNDFFTKAG